MGLFGEATDFGKRDDVREKADDQQPEAALDSPQNAPTEDAGNDQIGDNRQKEFHAFILARTCFTASVDVLQQ